MNSYIGTKIVQAEPMPEHEFLAKHRPYTGSFEASKITPPGRPGYKVVYDDGYTSWSPKDVFERCYRLVTSAEVILITGTVAP